MATEVTMPKLGQTMVEGTVVRTSVKPGDQVRQGDVLFEIETDKATVDVESPADGCVNRILVQDGQTLPVNAPMLILAAADEAIDDLVPAARLRPLRRRYRLRHRSRRLRPRSRRRPVLQPALLFLSALIIAGWPKSCCGPSRTFPVFT